MSQSTIPVTKFADVERRVELASGYVAAMNQIREQLFKDKGIFQPSVDGAKIERSIRKQHAKFYGLDNKYDGRGNLRELPY